MSSHFVFIVFDDPYVVGVLDFLVEALNGRRWQQPPHLTIQGPLPERPTATAIEHIDKTLGGTQLLIANPGIFETMSGAAVYLRVENESLRRVWNKPDYPIEKYGFNPHITLYDGPDVEMAQRAHRFLRSGKHRVELLCDQYSVVPYVSKQIELFPRDDVVGDEKAIQRMIASGKVGSAFRASFMAEISKRQEH
ncbi:2'-5' RNA ligase family protein [Pseudoxanthomonas wuyuanensis]|uniref:2'-5' RNA ligase family protein n=1 Tax=Pseudoxanthomonas wuyuanensis TaxID=1073196 RepID=UPI001143D2D5|nr:2'-5' RNA ligase family protein [Pseudoxanthomonas wuyuanensis]